LPELYQSYQTISRYAKVMKICCGYAQVIELIRIMPICGVLPKLSNYFKLCQNYEFFLELCPRYPINSNYDNLWNFAKVMPKLLGFAWVMSKLSNFTK
jgi:hypothetical protein